MISTRSRCGPSASRPITGALIPPTISVIVRAHWAVLSETP